ncbi:hypothetical protein BHM03_00004477 [Ensete ventricosum]|uniref:Uncharacterized protein n=1 Tax=Ensete ventricosum TaxID=4639 RepID=A0A445MAP1_ENSVE|nr:hypothetical protein BHM03_00004477 [Ensete ventricosum]
MLVTKDGQKAVVEDAMVVIAQVARCDEIVEAFRRMDDVRVLVRGSGRAREIVATALLNLVKNDEDKAVGDIREVAKAGERKGEEKDEGIVEGSKEQVREPTKWS